MKIDIVSIFPDYLAPLGLSLVGRAIETGIVSLAVHDLRRWTTDRHRTVDHTPYGGGAGMVMKPEPWGAALDTLVPKDPVPPSGADSAEPDERPRLIVLTPAGRRLTQAVAAELARAPHLILACGRYEGIDARVAEHAATRMRVDEVSVGDYVLNGGEAAALVVVEAVVRLLPGVVGNPESLIQESHAAEHDNLLEGPVYTQPPRWRGLDVPEMLFSGHHAQIAAWRREQALTRTRTVRPDLVPAGEQELVFGPAAPVDAGELFTLQRAAYFTEGVLNDSWRIPPLTETLAQLTTSLAGTETVLVVRQGGRLVGSVRGRADADGVWYVGRLMVAPDRQRHGIGTVLLRRIETLAPTLTTRIRLVTGAASRTNIGFYRRVGYRVAMREVDEVGVPIVVMEKPTRAKEKPVPPSGTRELAP